MRRWKRSHARRKAPAMPVGITYMKRITGRTVDRPRRRLGDLVGDVGHEPMKIAPQTAWVMEASPPTTMPIHSEIDRKMKLVRRHEGDGDRPQRAGDAGEHRADAERQRFVERAVDPHGGRGDRLVADRDQRAADPLRSRFQASTNTKHGHREREQVQPAVGLSLSPSRDSKGGSA